MDNVYQSADKEITILTLKINITIKGQLKAS